MFGLNLVSNAFFDLRFKMLECHLMFAAWLTLIFGAEQSAIDNQIV